MDEASGVIEKIERMREEKGWTKYRLAEEAELTYSSLMSMYARNTPPKLDILEMICSAFGISLAQFFSAGDAEYLTPDERDLLKKYRRLSPERKRALGVLIEK